MKRLIPVFILTLLSLFTIACKKEYRCTCLQDVMGIDTTFTLTGEGENPKKTCDAFDSEETTFGLTKTVDCEPL